MQVGCGATSYREGKWFSTLYTCNYGPNGNYVRGQMYRQGTLARQHAPKYRQFSSRFQLFGLPERQWLFSGLSRALFPRSVSISYYKEATTNPDNNEDNQENNQEDNHKENDKDTYCDNCTNDY